MVDAAAYRLLIDAKLIEGVGTPAETAAIAVDLSRALGGEAASIVVTCNGSSRARHLGVDAVHGLVALEDADFMALPPLIEAAAGADIDRMTCRPLDGAYAFRLKLSHSSAATTA